MWPPLKLVNLGGTDFASRFSALLFFSLLIERTVEILMGISRTAEANGRAAILRVLREQPVVSIQILCRVMTGRDRPFLQAFTSYELANCSAPFANALA